MYRKLLPILILNILLFTNVFPWSDEAGTVAEKFKNYFNATMQNVKNENNPEVKREILNNSLEKVDRILSDVSKVPGIPESDMKAITQLRKDYREFYNELNGLQGFSRVDDSQLNNFATYMMQSGDQAAKWLYISLPVLLIIIVILILAL